MLRRLFKSKRNENNYTGIATAYLSVFPPDWNRWQLLLSLKLFIHELHSENVSSDFNFRNISSLRIKSVYKDYWPVFSSEKYLTFLYTFLSLFA